MPMDIFILELVSNRLTVPVKIDGRQEQEENIGAIEPGSMYSYTRRTCAGLQAQYLQEKNAKLGGVVLNGGIHPNCY